MAQYTATVTSSQGFTVVVVLDTTTNIQTITVTSPNGQVATVTQPGNFDRATSATVNQILEQLGGNLTDIGSAIRLASSQVIREFQRETTASTESAGQQAAAAAPQGPTAVPVQTVQANGEVLTPPAVTPSSNAITAPTLGNGDGDQGTDAPIKTLTRTQATNGYDQEGFAIGLGVRDETGALSTLRQNPETGELYDPGGIPSAAVVTEPGVGANDDSGDVTNNQAGQEVVAQTTGVRSLIQPQPNILDQYASYTYQLSVYVFSPEQYNQFVTSGKKTINNYYLLFQSGGAAKNVGGAQGGPVGIGAVEQTYYESDGTVSSSAGVPPSFNSGPDAGRNPYFPQDFYIDTCTINNTVSAGGSNGSPHQSATLNFTVIEPNNITLLDRIYEAVQDVRPKDATGAINYSAAAYLMVIRFYGYDINGKLVAGAKNNNNAGLTDANAIAEKFIPFKINEIRWSVSNRLVSYDFVCVGHHEDIAATTRRGTVPFDIELTGGTVADVLSGNARYSEVSPSGTNPGASTTVTSRAATSANNFGFEVNDTASSSNASAAPPPTIQALNAGLVQALNQKQQELVDRGIYSKADVYKVVFPDSAKVIQSASITKPGARKNLATTPMAAAASQDAKSLDSDRQQSNVKQRNVSVKSGTQIVQVLDLIIRNSTYITDQANSVIAEDTDLPEPNPRANAKNVFWFRILMTSKQLEYDAKRNDYAYEITYTIVPFRLSEMLSPYFPLGQFPGIHKSYPYWFTGTNTSVLDYTAEFNKNYNLTVSGGLPGQSNAVQQKIQTFQSMRDIPFVNYYARSNQTAQGSDSKANELAASAAEYLYSPSSNANAKVTIIGDPAWIPQGTLVTAPTAAILTGQPFEPDGTINFDTNDVLFEVVWQRPEDYDIQTGLADPFKRTQKTFGDRQPRQSIIYKTRSVINEFKQGRFTQILDGTQYILPVPALGNQALGAAVTQPASERAVVTEPNRNSLNAAAELSLGGYNGGRPNAEQEFNEQRAAAVAAAGVGVRAETNPYFEDPYLSQQPSEASSAFQPSGGPTPAYAEPPAEPTSDGGIVGRIGNAVSGVFRSQSLPAGRGRGRNVLPSAEQGSPPTGPQITDRDW